MNFENIIYNGGFGNSGPMVAMGSNPYQNNIVQFGGAGYSTNPYMQPIYQQPIQYQAAQQYGYYQDPYAQQAMQYQQPVYQQPVQQPVYQPAPQYYQSQSMVTPQMRANYEYNMRVYGYNYGYDQPFGGDYYNPYPQYNIGGITFAQANNKRFGYPGSSMGNEPQYGHNNPMSQRQYIDQQKWLIKKKYKMVATYFGQTLNEKKLDKDLEMYFNPSAFVKEKSREERYADDEWNYMVNLSRRFPTLPLAGYNEAIFTQKMLESGHGELDKHSLVQFLHEDLWRIQRDQWVDKYINPRANRDLSSTYDSGEYNQLLNMHNNVSAVATPQELSHNRTYMENLFMKQLLSPDPSAEFEDPMGIRMAIDKETGRLKFLKQKVAEQVNDKEAERRRRIFTDQLMKQIYGDKPNFGPGAGKPNPDGENTGGEMHVSY